jgi:hypothetical protein
MLFGNQNGRNDLGDIDAVAMTLLKSIKKKQFVKMEEKTTSSENSNKSPTNAQNRQ